MYALANIVYQEKFEFSVLNVKIALDWLSLLILILTLAHIANLQYRH